MRSKLFVGVATTAVFGCGFIVGSQHERFQPKLISDDAFRLSRWFKIYASSIPLNQSPVTNIQPAIKSGSVVPMKYGVPSYENLLSYDGFILAYDKRNRVPLWVFEHLTREKVTKKDGINRDDTKFTEDEQVHSYFRATNNDYKKSGYDRGHMAAAGNHKWSQKAMDDTFHLTNMAPQVGKGFNRDAWNYLEKFVRHLTKDNKNVYVFTGPLYLPKHENDGKKYVKYEVIGRNHVAVPTHFYKVVVCESQQGDLELLSFVMPNKPLGEKVDLKTYLVPVDSIERASGLLFFNALPKSKLKKINGKAQ